MRNTHNPSIPEAKSLTKRTDLITWQDVPGHDESLEKLIAVVQNVIGAVRSMKDTYNLPPKVRPTVHLKAADSAVAELLVSLQTEVGQLSKAEVCWRRCMNSPDIEMSDVLRLTGHLLLIRIAQCPFSQSPVPIWLTTFASCDIQVFLH